MRAPFRGSLALFASLAILLAGCAVAPDSREAPPSNPERARALIAELLPPKLVADRHGWATDLYAALATLELPPSPENICAVIAVTEQESGFAVDPAVPGLAAIAWKEIDAHAASAHLPKAMVRTALRAPSRGGRSYAERIDAAKTERELSEIFEDLIGVLPLGKTFLSERNPVRTGGPMQVGIAFAQNHVKQRPYPYPMGEGGLRGEVFTRRGGLYFGTAHLLDYPARYEQMLFRFADFNAGHYASRNAAFQNAVSLASGVPLDLDGDLLRFGSDEAGATETAARVLAERLMLDPSDVREDLERGRGSEFEDTRLYRKVLALADRVQGQPAPRAVVPNIRLSSPKITRKLTTAWFANRVDERYRRCLLRDPGHSAR